MLQKIKILLNPTVILLLWSFFGYVFYSIWFEIVIEYMQFYSSYAKFVTSLTVGGLYGICLWSVMQIINIYEELTQKRLVLILCISLLILMIINFYLNQSKMFYAFSIFSILTFVGMSAEPDNLPR
jgi:hypothetical protein